MAWSTMGAGNGLGTQLTTLRVAVSNANGETSIRLSVLDSGIPESHTRSPFYKGIVAFDALGRPYAIGASADFPIVPKWRKVVRQIG